MRALSKIQAAIITLIFMICMPISSRAVDGQRKLTQPVLPATFPIIINQAGSYVLTSNLVVTAPNLNAIEITVNDVTIDLNGHKIQGPNTGSGIGNGIYAYEKYSITVKNGRIWGFGNAGIRLSSPSNHPSFYGAGHMISYVQTLNNQILGIVIDGGIISNCAANNNKGGIFATNCTINNCTVNNNIEIGINATLCNVTQCTANKNGEHGIYSNISNISDCTANENGNSGIRDFQRSRIVGNNVRHNAYGIYLEGPSGYAIKNVGSNNTSQNFFDAQSGTPGTNHMPIVGDNANYGW